MAINVNNEKLLYQYHLDEIAYITEGASDREYFVIEAQDRHALNVWTGSQNLISDALLAADQLDTSEAVSFIKYGLGRRSRAIFFSFRELYRLIPPRRTEPLCLDDADRASEILNSIYINIRGALDNIAWAFVSELGGAKVLGLGETQVSLFSQRMLKLKRLAELREALQSFDRWNRDFKRFRDPAAHRIPLSAVPTILGPADLVDFKRVDAELVAKRKLVIQCATERQFSEMKKLEQEADQIWDALQRIGIYRPLFEYAHDTQPMPIYPTVPEDIGSYVRIVQTTLPILRNVSRQKDSQ